VLGPLVAGRASQAVQMSRDATHLPVMNADPAKPGVAAAKG
jgi:hypothetical protein